MKIKEGFIVREIAGSFVVVPVGQNLVDFSSMITLNETGAFIFEQINDVADFYTIVEKFFSTYDVSKEEAEKAVESFVDYLKNSNLLEDDGQTKMKI